jgi:hypothetical protein
MRHVLRASGIGLTIAASALLTGCTGAACSGRDISPPGINLDARAWLSAHPGASLLGCLDNDKCVSLAGSRQLISEKPIGETTQFTLQVTGKQDGQAVLTSNQTVEIPVSSSKPGPCGTIQTQTIDLVLGADGSISPSIPG